jgi:hypothetical protein
MKSKLVCLAALVLALACRSNEKTAAAPKPAPPTDAEAQQYAAAYVEALTKPNLQRASQLIEWDSLIASVTAGDEFNDDFRA